MYNELFTRSFSKHEQKKLSVWAFIGCFVMALSFCALLNSYMGPLPLLNFQLASGLNLKVFSIIDTLSGPEDVRDANVSTRNTSMPGPAMEVEEVVVKKVEPLPLLICNFSLPRSDFCELNGDVRAQGKSSAIYVSSSVVENAETSNVSSWKLKPYARKLDKSAKQRVRELSVGRFGVEEMPECSTNHTVPGIVFSSGGYAGNHFHDFSDILVPLYLTARPFNGEVQFLVTDMKPWWLVKYKAYMDALSKYPIIDMDNGKEVHCFPRMIVGLKGHKEFGIEPSLSEEGYSMRSFTEFVRGAYSLKRSKVGRVRKPRLLIISRKGSRSVVNEEEVAAEARRLGFEVAIVEARRNLRDFSRMVNSFDVMVGVHGAGLTNSIFLPEKAVLIQVVPVGLEWLSKHDFEMPAAAMNLRYLEYRISGEESSLTRPESIKPQGWFEFKKLFLDGQNVRIDVGRFRNTLLTAFELLLHGE